MQLNVSMVCNLAQSTIKPHQAASVAVKSLVNASHSATLLS